MMVYQFLLLLLYDVFVEQFFVVIQVSFIDDLSFFKLFSYYCKVKFFWKNFEFLQSFSLVLVMFLFVFFQNGLVLNLFNNVYVMLLVFIFFVMECLFNVSNVCLSNFFFFQILVLVGNGVLFVWVIFILLFGSLIFLFDQFIKMVVG